MLTDSEIALRAPKLPILQIASQLGINDTELESYGNDKAKISWQGINRIQQTAQLGKLILVTSISPTPAGEGKTTTTIGLGDALAQQLHQKVAIALREPSMGPVFGLKGGATGGGQAQVVPMDEINLHFTGDMHALSSAINTLAALVDNYLYQGNELDLDPDRIELKRGIDVNDRTLRQVTIGQGSKFNGIMHETSFAITVANELMAILCLATSIDDLKQRIGNMLVGYTKQNEPVFVKQLGFQGAIAAILANALKPNLVQTIEHTPTFIHGGPFANIAHGTNSVISTNLALHLADYVVTEAGFGADLGGQKYIDFVSKHLVKEPDMIVVVATVRALKYQAEGQIDHLHEENLEALQTGFSNLRQHLQNVKQAQKPVVVMINKFATDTKRELALLEQLVKNEQVDCFVVNYHQEGSKGGVKAAEAVMQLSKQECKLVKNYAENDAVQTKIEKIASKIYHADKVEYSELALQKIALLKQLGKDHLPVIMAKTQYSFSDNPKLLGAPQGFTLHIKDLALKNGAGFIVVFTGKVLDMPGLPKHPAALDIDVDNIGKISGLF